MTGSEVKEEHRGQYFAEIEGKSDSWKMNGKNYGFERYERGTSQKHILYSPSEAFGRHPETDNNALEAMNETQGKEHRLEHEAEPNKKQSLFTYDVASDETASTLSMSVTSDERSKSVQSDSNYTHDDQNHQPVHSRGPGDDYSEYMFRQATQAFKRQTESVKAESTNIKSKDLTVQQLSRGRLRSSFHDHLALKETKSYALRREAKPFPDPDVIEAKCNVHRPSRDPSPLHDRLALQHTHSTASKQSIKLERRDTNPFYTFVKSDSFHGSEVGSFSKRPNEMEKPKVRQAILTRGSSPFHERLALHHTHATASKQSTKPEKKDTTPFYTFVKPEQLNGNEAASISMLPNETETPKVRRATCMRDASPLHERLAHHHTHSTASKQSAKPEKRDTTPFYTFVKPDKFNGSEVASISMLPNETEKPKVHHAMCMRDASPLHERLALHHTHATASKQSAKPEKRDTTPFYTFVRASESFNGTEVASISMLPNATEKPTVRRTMCTRDASQLHERLANYHTVSSQQKMQPPGVKDRRHRNPSPTPFYTVVASNSCSSFDDVSTLTKQTYGAPTPTRASHTRQPKVPLPPRSRHTRNKSGPSGSEPFRSSTRGRQPLPPRPSGRNSTALKGKKSSADIRRRGSNRRNDVHDKQDALFHRLSNQDTIASSRMKPIPLNGKILSPYERRKKVETENSRKSKSSKSDTQVYNRLINRGTKASLRKQMLATRFNSEHETFGEGCKNALMRKFEGSTFMHV